MKNCFKESLSEYRNIQKIVIFACYLNKSDEKNHIDIYGSAIVTDNKCEAKARNQFIVREEIMADWAERWKWLK